MKTSFRSLDISVLRLHAWIICLIILTFAFGTTKVKECFPGLRHIQRYISLFEVCSTLIAVSQSTCVSLRAGCLPSPHLLLVPLRQRQDLGWPSWWATQRFSQAVIGHCTVKRFCLVLVFWCFFFRLVCCCYLVWFGFCCCCFEFILFTFFLTPSPSSH